MKRNRIIYVFTTVLMLVLYIWTGSIAALLMVGLLVVVALLMFVVAFGTAHDSQVSFCMPSSSFAGKPVQAVLVVDRGFFLLPLGRFTLEFACSNPVFRSEWTETLTVETGFARHTEYRLDVCFDDFGCTDITLQSCSFTGVLGLFSAALEAAFTQRVLVNPSPSTVLIDWNRQPRSAYQGETYSNLKRGNDVSEVFDIRDYKPGDAMQSVHWKLSSKLDILVAREFSEPTNYEILIANDIALMQGDTEVPHDLLNGAASILLSLSSALLQEGIAHDLAVTHGLETELYPVDCTATLADAEQISMETPLRESHESIAHLFSLNQLHRRFTKLILVTCVYDEPSWSLLANDVDLTVIVVSPHALMQARDPQYSLIALDVKGLGNHVHHIDI